MSLIRVCEMEYKLSVPKERFWDRFVLNETAMCNHRKRRDDIQPSDWTQMEIESVDQTKTMKERFVKPEFVQGYKLIAATTKVIDDEPSGLNCLIYITTEYEKSGLEIKDLEEVQLLDQGNIKVMALLEGNLKIMAHHCRARVGGGYPMPVRLR
ncbi:PREDICTED: uncharacterized protein LOC104793631 [Camelina sativa]|uniref:Uncharacterized protein LOC104793631 n=1 Tax=Camelina sativa TaxID=90675 RepID=A0ABM0ZNQ0_CAMSA|nr:PREDICTED: uncharacterized protein LOC104793631 [Camelina sativa]